MTEDEKVHGAPEGAAVADEKLLTVPQAAARAEVDVSAIYRWFREGTLAKHTRRVGRIRTWVDRAELDALVVPGSGAEGDATAVTSSNTNPWGDPLGTRYPRARQGDAHLAYPDPCTPWPSMYAYALAHRCPTCKAAQGVPCQLKRQTHLGTDKVNSLHRTRSNAGQRHSLRDRRDAGWPEDMALATRYDSLGLLADENDRDHWQLYTPEQSRALLEKLTPHLPAGTRGEAVFLRNPGWRNASPDRMTA